LELSALRADFLQHFDLFANKMEIPILSSYAIWKRNKIGLLDMENNRELKSKILF